MTWVLARKIEGFRPRTAFLARALSRVRPHWPVVAVLAVYAAAAVIVPTLTPVATTDDWGYSRPVEILLREGRLTIFPVVAATAVFQVLWGALFALLFGVSLGVVRVATVVMVALGALALYGICRRLGVARGRSALGAAAYLFNPLSFSLAFTFMTDPHFTALLLIATFLYLRGLEPDGVDARATILGSTAAAAAFLTRQQGALIPFAVVVFLLLSRRLPLRPTRRGLVLLLRVTAIPAVSVVGYYVWLRYANDVPDVQQSFSKEMVAAGWGGSWELARNLTFIELMYLGFFALPVAAAAIPGVRRAVVSTPWAGWLAICGWEAIVVAGLAVHQVRGGRMPYIPQFVGAGGIGPPDVLGAKPRLFAGRIFDVTTAVCAAATLLLAVVLCRALGARGTPGRANAGLIVAIGLCQVVGILPPSYHYLNRGFSLDRYLLPLLPLSICLALWASRDLRLFSPVAWAIVAVFAVYSTVGTRDYLVYMGSVWDMAASANADGVANDRLDAGAAWDGYHLYTYALDNHITQSHTPYGPWWTDFYGKPTDSSYVVSGLPRDGYDVVNQREYSSWLGSLLSKPGRLYLLRRHDLPGPP